jgi:hypothetical protein
MATKPGTVPKTAAKRPQPKGGSRKGVPNKATKELKDMILGALDAAGGVDYLTERAIDPRTASAFLTLVGKVLPLQVAGDANNPLTVVIRKLTDGH